MRLKISKDLELPLDVVTQVEVILAKRRAGKSYTMRRICEQLLIAQMQVVLVDPKGDQWGLRSSADGKRPGFPVLILGGEHGDLPLEANGGEVVARLVVEERVSILLDLSTFRKHEIATFMTAFLENLYRLKAQEKYRTPVKLVVDEADAIAPQKPQKGEERMLGAIEDIVRRGGQRGIGCTLVTQRSAVLNKNVLTQAQMLIVLRTIAPQDLAAMKAWIDVHGTPEQANELMASLPSLPIGDAWFWSPGWPTDEGIFKRVHVLPIETFDSGATPKPGEKKVVPKNLADVDLEALKGQMAATIEKAKQDDPKLLRKRIAELEKESKQAKPAVSVGRIDQEQLDRAIVQACKVAISKRDSDWMRALKPLDQTFKSVGDIFRAIEKMGPLPSIQEIAKQITASVVSPTPIVRQEQEDKRQHVPVPRERTGFDSQPALQEGITGPEQRVLNAVAWMENIEVREPVAEIVAFLSGYAHLMSKGFTNPRGTLKAKSLITYPSPGRISLTDEGRRYAQFPDHAGTTEELQRMVLERLDGPKQRLLKPLIEAYPNSMTAEALCEAAGYMHPMSKGFTNPRGKLKSFGLITYPTPGHIRAADILFLKV